MPELVTLDEIESAYRRVGDRVHHTPTLSARTIGAELGVEMWLKAELLQRAGSFKIRGVLNTLLSLSPDELANGVVTMSSGNHAAALAAGAAMVGTTATIVMPAHANEFKVAATRRYGGTPVLTDRHLADVMTEIADAEKRVVIHPFDDMRIIAGAAGVGLELIDDAPPLDLVVVPVGGGGLVSGVAAAVKLTDGVVEEARLVLGAVGSSPVDQSPLAAPLVGERPSREAIRSVAAEAYKGARPLDNTDLNYAWRKKMARVYVERALAKVCYV